MNPLLEPLEIGKDPLIITRMTEPTSQDTAPYGTICICNDSKEYKWIQMSHDEEKPNWISFRK